MGESGPEPSGVHSAIAIGEILGERRTGLVDTREATGAIEKVRRAGSDMKDTKIQREERKARRRPMHTREMWCVVNTEPLQDIETKGREKGEEKDGQRKQKDAHDQKGEEDGWAKTVTQDAIELNQRVVRNKDGTGKVRLAYHYLEKGRDVMCESAVNGLA